MPKTTPFQGSLPRFKTALAAKKTNVDVFRSPGQVGSREDLSALRDWLTALPKPAAVMASWDTRATQVLAMCKDAQIKIPSQVAVLGVDNDELLDESCVPPLTSILPDHEKLGYAAARALERLMAGRGPKDSKPFLIRPVKSSSASRPPRCGMSRGLCNLCDAFSI